MTYTMHFDRHFKSAIKGFEWERDNYPTSEEIPSELKAWSRSLIELCRTDDVAGAIARVREKIDPDNETYVATVTALRMVRTWDASRGLLRVSDRDLIQRAQARYPGSVEEWACVQLLLDTHIELEPVLRCVSYHVLPDRVRSVARASTWGAVYRAIVERYPWLRDPVAELEAQRLLGFGGTPMEFFESLMAFMADAMNGRLDASSGEAVTP